jgi:uncharacterized protein (DUF305 family)
MLKRLLIAGALVALPAVALAQDFHQMAATPELPASCLANAPAPMSAPMHQMTGGDGAHVDLMDGMDQMNADMMAGGTATDIGVAFVCSMIPHHRGAIDMAKAELAHGDDPWAKELAQKVIAAQEQEIADMIAWLQKQPQ